MTPGATLLELRGIETAYGAAPVLREIDLAVRCGELLAILGPSGSGKTTLLRAIAGFIRPMRGAILLEGADIGALPVHRRPFNTVFQDYALFPHLSVARNVGYGLLVRGVAKREIRGRVDRALALMQLERFAGRFPAQLSGGQRQRVALARALICEPRLILLDEPLAALDAELRRDMQGLLKRVQQELGATLLFVTHDQEEAWALADRICVLSRGRVLQLGTPQELYYRPRSEAVARFFGNNNLLEATLGAGDALRRRAQTAAGSFLCAVDGQPDVAAAACGEKAVLAVRPEAIQLGRADSACENRMRVHVERVQFIGPTCHIQVRSALQPGVSLEIAQPSRASGAGVEVGGLADAVWSAGECRLVLP